MEDRVRVVNVAINDLGRNGRGAQDPPTDPRAGVPAGRSHKLTATVAGRRGTAMDIRLKRAYEPAAPSDGYRVLIDRLWPRGVSRARARLDEWDQELPPSTRLREWFGHEPSRFGEFRRRYIEELRGQRPRLTELRRRARTGALTLVYAARDTEHNEAVVLAQVLRRGLPNARKRS
jgi:uncharacterized protein YeaO (DUF488 family)